MMPEETLCEFCDCPNDNGAAVHENYIACIAALKNCLGELQSLYEMRGKRLTSTRDADFNAGVETAVGYLLDTANAENIAEYGEGWERHCRDLPTLNGLPESAQRFDDAKAILLLKK